MLGTESLHQLDIHGLVTVCCQDAKMSLAPVKRTKITMSLQISSNRYYRHINSISDRSWVTNGSCPQRLQKREPNYHHRYTATAYRYKEVTPYLSRALAASRIPRARPSWMSAVFSTSGRAVLTSITPPAVML